MSKSPELTKAIVKLLIDHPFWGCLAMGLEPVGKQNMLIPTMGTDGRRIYYDPDFVKRCSQAELMGVIAHEIAHIFLYHLARRQNREPMRWNIASDFAVNALVLEEFTLPQGALWAINFKEKTVEEIYNQIIVQVGMNTIDSHDDWDRWDDSLEQEWRGKVAQAANQARMQGKLPEYLQTIVDGILQPKLDWRTILRDMVTSCVKSNYRLVPPAKKHVWRKIWLPSTTGEELDIAVAIDTSGSISDDEIKEFLSEVKGICDSYENYTIYLFSCDARIHQRWEIHPFDSLPKIMKGRGGTSFVEPLHEGENLPISLFIYLSDGYGDYPDKKPSYPVIWVLTEDFAEPPWGQKIVLRT